MSQFPFRKTHFLLGNWAADRLFAFCLCVLLLGLRAAVEIQMRLAGRDLGIPQEREKQGSSEDVSPLSPLSLCIFKVGVICKTLVTGSCHCANLNLSPM